MPPSSTSSSEPASATAAPRRSAWYGAARTLLAVLAFVVAADLALRRLSPFELYDDWEHQQIAYKEAKYRAFVARRRAEVILTGSSVIMDLDARRMGKQAHARIFNGGIGSGNPTSMTAVLEHAYYPYGKPRLVVYATSARDLRDNDPDPYNQPPFFSHRMRSIRAKKWQERVEVALERYSYLFRIRRQLRDLAHRGELPQGVKIKTDDYGSRKYKPQHLVATLKGRTDFPADYAYRSRYDHYRIDFEHGHVRQLISLIERNRADGIETILVNVPLSPAAMSLFDRREADYETYRAALREVARRANVPLYDAHGELALTNRDFYDADHMAKSGVRQTEDYLSPIIAEHLRRR